MSALLQFGGKVNRKKGVRLEFVLKGAQQDVPCHICRQMHEQLYVAWRKPVAPWCHWVVFRYLGEEHVPDLSIPITVPKVPRGAVALSPEENSKAWHR